MVPQWIIEKKRDGNALDEKEIREFIAAYTAGTIPDYQMSALAMAIFFRGMSTKEMATLTDAMMHSGDRIDWSDCPLPTADKHSTGGIGDKLSLIIAPLVATQDVAVPMISGRGLGITGGTLDKLESIPGYNTCLPIPAFKEIVKKVGCSIIGQSDRLAPADKKLYALRDVTGTVPSIPLITASIMSKKLAEGAETLVFDVKCGCAAFMNNLKDAQLLARCLEDTGRAMGRKCASLVTDMNQPLGWAVGNAVEVAESVETLKNAGPKDTRNLILSLSAKMVALAHPERSLECIDTSLKQALQDGTALQKFSAMIQAHGGDPRFIEDPSLLPHPGAILDVPSSVAGHVENVNAKIIGKIVLQLGGGRMKVTDKIDPAVGIDRLVREGDPIEVGQPLMRLLARDETTARSFFSAARDAVQIR